MNPPLAEAPRASRWFRLALRLGRPLVLLLFLLGAAWLYLNQIGLPAFLKARVEAELTARGIDLRFGRLRLHGLRTLIADNVSLDKAPDANRPDLAISRAELRLDAHALRRFQLRMEALIVRHGRLDIPFTASNQPPAHLPFEDINLELRFLPNAQFDLADFRARCRTLEVLATGTMTNAPGMRKPRPGSASEKSASRFQEHLREFAAEFERMTLSPASKLQIKFHGDGRDASSFRATLEWRAASASSHWGSLENFLLKADLAPSEDGPGKLDALCEITVGAGRLQSGEFAKASFTGRFTLPVTNLNLAHGQGTFELSKLETPWGGAEQLIIAGKTPQQAGSKDNWRLDLTATGQAVRTAWGKAGASSLTADLAKPANESGTLKGSWRLDLKQLESPWGTSEEARLSGHLRHSPIGAGAERSDASWGGWQKLEPFQLDWEGQLSRLSSEKLQIEKISGAGEWRAPDLIVRNFQAQLYDGRLDLNAALNITNREVRSQVAFDFDVHRLSSLLATNSGKWLRQFAWKTPPRVTAEAQLLLPAWTNREPDRFQEAIKTLAVRGSFTAEEGSYRGVPVSSARSHFNLSNSIWRLPDLVIARPEGQVHLDGREDTTTHEYQWSIRSQVDLKALEPLLDPEHKRVLDFFAFSQPPLIQGRVWGEWRKPDAVGFSAKIALTNFTFKKETFDSFSAGLQFTNQFLELRDVDVQRGKEQITATQVSYDPKTDLVHVTNAITTMDADLVTRLISAPVRAAVEPYHFKTPPRVVVNGQLPTRGVAEADVTFKVAGQTFNYWRFNVPEISGDVHWRGDTVTVTNLQAAFYGGKLDWEGHFDFSGPPGARYRFRARAEQCNLQPLVADLTDTNTALEGILDGDLIITAADTRDWESWQGHGVAQLQDGYLWTVPIFGFFSPALNKLVPGLGQNRLSAGTASFTIDKGLIRTGNLEMKSPALRLQYVGNVDFKGRVEARVQAEIFRNAWAVGRVLSLALWPVTKVLEYKVTGTLNEPKADLLYFPKFLMLPFHPLKTLKDILPVDRPQK